MLINWKGRIKVWTAWIVLRTVVSVERGADGHRLHGTEEQKSWLITLDHCRVRHKSSLSSVLHVLAVSFA